MTDLDLQRAIVTDLKQHLLRDGIMMIRNKEFQNIRIFTQELPLKADDEYMDDEMQWNYITVMLGEQDVVEGENQKEWQVEVHFLIGIMDDDEMCQGNLNISYLMNEIYLHFRKQPFLENEYKMMDEAYKRFNLNNSYPFYEGDLITLWKLPLPHAEGLEEFL